MVEKKLIGVIDDNIQTAVSISQTLDFNGFRTFQAYNEKSLREELKNKKPDLIIISANLASESTICTLLGNLKAIILLVGHSPKILCHIKNIRGTLIKPIEPEVLLKKVKEELNLD